MNLTYLAGGPTELRILLMVMTTCMMTLGPVPSFWSGISAYDLFIMTLAVILIGVFHLPHRRHGAQAPPAGDPLGAGPPGPAQLRPQNRKATAPIRQTKAPRWRQCSGSPR